MGLQGRQDHPPQGYLVRPHRVNRCAARGCIVSIRFVNPCTGWWSTREDAAAVTTYTTGTTARATAATRGVMSATMGSFTTSTTIMGLVTTTTTTITTTR